MKTLRHATLLIVLAVLPAHAQRGTLQFGEPPQPSQPPPPPPVYQTPPPVTQPPPAVTTDTPAQSGPVYVYDQKPIAGRPALMTPEQAQTIISRFKEAYPGMGSPRLLIYVNRELVDEKSGLKLIRRDERIQSRRDSTGTSPGSTIRSTVDNTYRADGKAEPTLADKQTVRDIERLFGRPLRSAGASLADQRVATQLIADKPMEELIGTTDTPEARKDREALEKITDVVIEILISSRTNTVTMISGDQTILTPDIQATAIRLKDSKILGQAASSDVTGRVPQAMLANFGVGEISEATALALMEDMTPEGK
jgi:hypothetical protein